MKERTRSTASKEEMKRKETNSLPAEGTSWLKSSMNIRWINVRGRDHLGNLGSVLHPGALEEGISKQSQGTAPIRTKPASISGGSASDPSPADGKARVKLGLELG